MFDRGHLTRGRGVDPRNVTFAVLDLETTGLHPENADRVCEIAVVRMRGDGTVLDEYSTLVHPGVPIRNGEFHGITDVDVKGAPVFTEVADDVQRYLSGAVVVAHNLDFEERFLTAEFARAGRPGLRFPGLCTLETARIHLNRYGYRLDEIAYLITGVWPGNGHQALEDARVLALTLAELIAKAPQRLSWLGPQPGDVPHLPLSGRIAPRAAGLRKGAEGWLSTLVSRLPAMKDAPEPVPAALEDYRAMLGHALADGKVVGDEAAQLGLLAARAGLTQHTARLAHDDFLLDARRRAESDGIVTPAELRELQRAGRELAASHLIADLEAAARADRDRRNGPLKGWRILTVGGTAAALTERAVENGATIAVNVTATVRLVIAEDPGSPDPRLRKAMDLGVRVVSVEEGTAMLDAAIESGRVSLLAVPEGGEVAARLERERAAERDARADRPEWHGDWRPRQLSPAEYRTRFVERREDWDEQYVVVVRGSGTEPETVSAGKGGGCGTACLAVLGVVASIAALTAHLLS